MRAILNDLIEERYQLAMDPFQSVLCDIPSANGVVDSHMLIAKINGIAPNYLYAENNYPLQEIKDRFIKKYLSLLGLSV